MSETASLDGWVLRQWSALPTLGRVTVIGVTVFVIAVIVAMVIGSGSRDEGSYQYGRTQESVMARSLWKTVNKVPGSNITSIEDACTTVVDADMKGDSPQAASMRRMDREDIIEGCVDVLKYEQKLGSLPRTPTSTAAAQPYPATPTQAPPAQACGVGDPSVLCPMEQAFIDDLGEVGITSRGTPKELVNLGWRLCGLLSTNSRDSVVQSVFNDRNLSYKQSQDLVDIAHGRLCPHF